jgi:hypothetical protein
MLSPLSRSNRSPIGSVSNISPSKYQPPKKNSHSSPVLLADTFQLQQKSPKFGSYSYMMQESGNAMRQLKGSSGGDDDDDKNNPNRNYNTNKKPDFLSFFKKKNKKENNSSVTTTVNTISRRPN